MFTQTVRGYFGVQSYIYRRITGAIPGETLQLDIIYDDEGLREGGKEEKKVRRYSRTGNDVPLVTRATVFSVMSPQHPKLRVAHNCDETRV